MSRTEVGLLVGSLLVGSVVGVALAFAAKKKKKGVTVDRVGKDVPFGPGGVMFSEEM